MNFSLTPQLEELVHAKVATGQYNFASDVIREALRLLEERDRARQIQLDELKREIASGIEDIENGRATEYDEESVKSLAQSIKLRGRKKMVANKKRRA